MTTFVRLAEESTCAPEVVQLVNLHSEAIENSGGGLPTGWLVDTPFVGDFLYGPAYPGEEGQRTIQLGIAGDDDSDGIRFFALCFAGSEADYFIGPGDTHLQMVADDNGLVGMYTQSGMVSRPSAGTTAFQASGDEGATIALDAGELLVSNLANPQSAQDAVTQFWVLSLLGSQLQGSDPHVSGAMWNNAGIATFSSG